MQLCNATLKKFVHDSEILKKSSLNRLKAARLIKYVIAIAQRDRLINILRTQRFSIVIDESTDGSTLHSFCIIVRYFDYKQNCIVDSVWDLVEIYDTANALADADSIFSKLIHYFPSSQKKFRCQIFSASVRMHVT